MDKRKKDQKVDGWVPEQKTPPKEEVETESEVEEESEEEVE